MTDTTDLGLTFQVLTHERPNGALPYREVLIETHEGAEPTRVFTPLLTPEEARVIAERLREIADQLEAVGLVHDGVRRAAA